MRRIRVLILTAWMIAGSALPAFAQTSDILSPLTRLVEAIRTTLTGPLGLAVSIVALAAAAISVALGGAHAARWVIYVAVGAALLFGSETIISFIAGR
ncbi:MAG: TrbC/VirB2 family protein [bacterium]|nr:TrbC/VirB2 family protein [bacterium]